MKIFMSSNGRNQNETSIRRAYYNNSDDSCFRNIDGFAPVKVNVPAGTPLLVTLVIPDTWCDRPGELAWFGIKANKKIVARGCYSSAMGGQRVPFTLQTVIAADGNMEIQPVWCNAAGTQDACHIGAYSESVLTVLVNDQSISGKEAGHMMDKMPGFDKLKGKI